MAVEYDINLDKVIQKRLQELLELEETREESHKYHCHTQELRRDRINCPTNYMILRNKTWFCGAHKLERSRKENSNTDGKDCIMSMR